MLEYDLEMVAKDIHGWERIIMPQKRRLDRGRLKWRSKRSNHGRKPNIGRRQGKIWKGKA